MTASTTLSTCDLGEGRILGSLHSHGSAIVNITKQVASRAGTALFITHVTFGALTATSQDSDAGSAQASGVHSALV